MLRTIVSRLFCLVWITVALTRLDIFQAFGAGTGKNKIGFSPLDVACFSGIYAANLRGQGQLVKKLCQGVGVPGEIFRKISRIFSYEDPQSLVQNFDLDEAFESSKQWMKANTMKGLINQKQDYFSGLAAVATIISMLLAFFRPREASLIFILSIVALQVTLRQYEPSVKITEQIGMYTIGIAVISYILGHD